MDIKKLIRPNILALTPYSSARDEFTEIAEVYIDANENPFENGVNRYPDPYQMQVKNRLSEIKGIPTENMLIGNGSDEVLDLIFRVFCEPKQDNIISHNPSYGMYPVLCEVNDVELRKVNLEEGFILNAEEIINASDERTKIFFICSPNNPSGNLLQEEAITKVLESKKGIVVIDEAYIDFAHANSWITKLKQYSNLIVCQTLSKAWGLAGLRVGMCYASKEIITILNAIKPPYNVNELSQQRALEALNNKDEFDKHLATIMEEKDKMESALAKIELIEKIHPSDANFLLVKVPNANALYEFLLEHKIIVRNRTKEYLCKDCIRITIGTPEENVKLIEGIKAFK
ncbi:histidinol-phosphate transaminase [Reichenbachiella versicolor]|uniref:histidinol-phosphate transaminase n=1 Tax=Reichenbachiella versicolor TaxID=1821036 RepID=UPI000D6E557A|nr:histidinol-phosphate transaminase [Reichenbachiella versicolor]